MYKREWKLEDRRKNEELTDRWIYRFSVGRRGECVEYSPVAYLIILWIMISGFPMR